MDRIVQSFIKLANQGQLHGVYEGVPDYVYNHPDFPGVRSGLLKAVLKQSYHHAKKPQPDKEHLVEGQVFHSAMEGMKPAQLRERYGLVGPQMDKFKNMVDSIRSHPRFEECYRGAMREVTMFATCRYTGLLLRCRCDLWHPDTGLITDYKTTLDASEEGFSRASKRFGYRMSACFYSAVAQWATNRRVEEFRIIAVEKSEPYFAAQFSYSSESFELDTEKMVRGLFQIKKAQEGGHQGYSTDVIELRY